MANQLSSDSYFYAGNIIIRGFIVFAVLSYAYALFMGRYNGDFMAEEVEISHLLLFINLVITILPFIFLQKVYRYFKLKYDKVVKVPINFRIFTQFLYFLFAWHIIVTLLFDVGKMGSPIYSAPSLLVIPIQLFNRFNPLILGLVFILVSNNKKRILLICFLMIFLGVLRAGLGVFIFISMALFVKFNFNFISFIKRKKMLLFVAILLFPIFVQNMYVLRSGLRSESYGDLEKPSTVSLIGGKLLGRLSSFSNSGIIMQNSAYFLVESQFLDEYYFQKQALAGIIGTAYMPAEKPENQLIKSVEPSAENTSYMTGTQGNLILSLYKSPFVFIVNLITIMVLIYLNFSLAIRLGFAQSTEFALINTIYCVMSGVSNEYTFNLFTTVLLLFFFYIIKLISSGNKRIVYSR